MLHCFVLVLSRISWLSPKCVVAKTAWLRNLLLELHAPLSTATLVYCDNVSAVYLSINPVQHQRTKHIEIDIHFFLIGQLNREIAPVAIIDHQLPFEYTIASRSTDVMVMVLPVQNINHSAFRSMFEKEKLSGNNFNDWFRQLKLVLRVEKKMFVIEQPLPAAPAVDSEAQILAQWNAVYDAYNEVACLILGSMTPELHRQFENSSPYDMIKELKSMFEKQARVERFDLIQTFHACKQEEGKPIGPYVLKMKGYVKQLERLGYVLLQDISVGLILNDLTSDFSRFVRNYNMHNMGKTVGELHALLIEYEKGYLKSLPYSTSKWRFKVVES
ncbi:retrotransposon protein, putative, ty1-copia subclass [Tanacetum coccineum]